MTSSKCLLRTFRYPLHPTYAQEKILTQWLEACCDLYNAALQERREGWRRGLRIRFNDQTASLTVIRHEDPKFAAMPVMVLRSALARLQVAFEAFFQRCNNGEKPGYPRFRSRRRYDSFSWPAPNGIDNLIQGKGRSGRLAVPKLGDLRFNLYRIPRGVPRTVRIQRESTGKWWVSIACDLGAAPAPVDAAAISPDRVVGIDVGLQSLAALSTGTIVGNPRHVKRAETILARRQRVLSRRRNGSASRKRAVKLVARAHAHVKNQRLDYARKFATKLVRDFDFIAHEDLNIASLAASTLGKHVNNAGWRILLHAIACKAECAGKVVVQVDPRGTSQECSACGGVVQKSLAVRVHDCQCGLRVDRDVNAARNILARGMRVVSKLGDSNPSKARRSRGRGSSADQT
ncbi:RNA-guided endonuclease InsQ/TnpB family protein [Polyangium sorediatum]|uniref:Transposase n=1 Tax=Polyangium sorediatum TaxID=889274 RepID=A0ABT6NWC0_9BACT|nr:RNA-guided endonuclease TnpB family protein [Polyangium sorediatum]MDI1432641.1 transposase [Polyangium sorediatum]